MWQDTRNREICDRLKKWNDLSFVRTGSRINSVFSGSKMTWVRSSRPDIYDKVHKFVNIPEYINFLITGNYCSDVTYASRSGLFNIHTKKWDPELLDLYQVDEKKLLPLVEPGDIIGYSTTEFERKTGLPCGTPVISCGGDQQCAAIGQGVTSAGNVSVVAGTGGFLIAALDEVPESLSDNVICNCSSIAGKYVIEANVLACSAAFDWFGRELYGMDKINYTKTEAELQSECEVTNCLVIPYFKGRGAPDWNTDAKAAFFNVTLATRRSELFKSMMESIFMELGNHMEQFSKYVPIHNICISGGLTNSQTLNQLQADVYGRTVYCRTDKEATAKGAFLVAMTSLGHFQSLDEAAAKLIPDDGMYYHADPSRIEKYRIKQREMNNLYKKLYI
jgi:sugar (pentulose or hexulose) kinase